MTLRLICSILYSVRSKKSSKDIRGLWSRYQYVIVSLIVVMVASGIFALRYTPAFTSPNFYAEDGRVFTKTVLDQNVVTAAFTGFNGYLVVGQYELAEVAVATQSALGLPFYQLPVVIAVVSCLFLGLTVSLPYILLRKQLGVPLALTAVVLGAMTPLPSFDYAIIGTIGNLKFAFLYWAFILILYRNYNFRSLKKCVVTDTILLLSILTYAPAAALIPFALWPYREKILLFIRKKHKISVLTDDKQLVSLAVLAGVVAIYLGVVLIKGIPAMPGYLDSPYNAKATLKIAFHSTWYAWLFPIVHTMRDSIVLGLLGLTAYAGLRYRQNRFIFIFAAWAIATSIGSFVINRTGISSFFMAYIPGPDQFFYAQRLIFMLICLWAFRPILQWAGKLDKAALLLVFALFMIWSHSYTGSFGGNEISYKNMGSAKQNLDQACKVKGKTITMQNYPSTEWQWVISKDIACQ